MKNKINLSDAKQRPEAGIKTFVQHHEERIVKQPHQNVMGLDLIQFLPNRTG